MPNSERETEFCGSSKRREMRGTYQESQGRERECERGRERVLNRERERDRLRR